MSTLSVKVITDVTADSYVDNSLAAANSFANAAATSVGSSYGAANSAYNTANAAFNAANNVNLGPVFSVANAAYGNANTKLSNTSGVVFSGDIRFTGNVNTNIVKSNTIQGFDGTNYIVNGYPRMPGQVIEYLSSPCDGSSITVGSGTYTFQNVTTQQTDTSYTYVDLTGSSLSYTPPTGTTRVIYRFSWTSYWASAHAISHNKFYIDGVEVLYARHSRSGYYHEGKSDFEWTINIGGSGNTNTGRQASWTTAKIMKMQYRAYGGSDIMYQHGSMYWDGNSGNQFNLPHLTIIAIA